MHRILLDFLTDPASEVPLALEAPEEKEGEIFAGRLRADAATYPIVNGIPRFVTSQDDGQRQTEKSFGFKWRQLDSYGSAAVFKANQAWLLQRYGFSNPAALRLHFGRGTVLDAGCGGGFAASLWLDDSFEGLWLGVDISEAIDVARERLGAFPRAQFVQADILNLPFRRSAFDFIMSEGVLHHTPSTERAFRALAALLKPRGELMVYVYRKKAPVREFTDDHIRAAVSVLAPEAAWDALKPLTRLGQTLAEVGARLTVHEDVPQLGLKAGEYDLHRLIYWHFAKLFWNKDYSFAENLHVNFDWYHPYYAHRHTEEEIRRWCASEGLRIIHFCTEESGYTVRAVKP